MEMALDGIAVICRHEDVMNDPQTETRRVAHVLGYMTPLLDVSVIGRKRCDPSDVEQDRMGQPGKWREILEEGVVRALWRYCFPVIERLGYEW